VLHEHDLPHRIKTAPGSVTLEEAQHADNTITALSGVILVLTLATAVVSIIWFHRASENADGWAPLMQRITNAQQTRLGVATPPVGAINPWAV
jgi:hypothetical protein